MKKLLAITITLALITGTVTAQDDITIRGEDEGHLEQISPEHQSQDTEITQIVHLESDIDPENINDGEEHRTFQYTYMNTDEDTPINGIENVELEYLQGGYWKAEIDTEIWEDELNPNARAIEYEILDDADNTQAEATQQVQLSEIHIHELPEEPTLVPGREETIEFEIENAEIDSSSSRVAVTDGENIHYNSETVLSGPEFEIEVPEETNEEYYVQLFIEDSETSDQAADSMKILTDDPISLNVADWQTEECETENNQLENCYPESEITIDYQTNIEAEQIEVDMDYDGTTINTETFHEPEEDGDLTVQLPTAQEISDAYPDDISDDKQMEINVIAESYTGETSNEIEDFNYQEFEINIAPLPDYSLGLEEEFSFQIEHPLTGEGLSPSEVSSPGVDIGEDTTLGITDFYSDGIYRTNVYLDPDSFQVGSTEISLEATSDTGGYTQTESQPFQIVPLEFSINDHDIQDSSRERGREQTFGFNVSTEDSDRTFAPEKIVASESNFTIYREVEDEEEEDELIANEDISEDEELLDLWYDEDTEDYQAETHIPLDAETGSHYAEIEITIEQETVTETFPFEIIEQAEVFQLEETEKTFDIDSSFANYTETIQIQNYESEEITLETEVSEGINQNLSINDTITLEPETETETEMTIEYTTIDSPSGEITFTNEATDTERTLDIETLPPVCHQTEETICSQGLEELEFYTNETEPRNETIDIINFNESVNTTRTLDGNITNAIYLPSFNSTLEGEDEVTFTIDPLMRGNFTGDLELETEKDETLTWEIDVESDIPPQDLAATTTDIDLEGVPEEGDAETQITIENTGTQPITEINIEIEDYGEVTETPQSIEAGETTNATLEFQEITEIPNSLDIELVGTADTQNIQTSVTGEVIPDITQQTDSQYDDLRNLQTEYTNIPNNIRDEIDEGQALLDEADLEWEDGNYQEAQEKFEEAEQIYNDAEQDLITLEQERQQEQQGQQEQQQQQEDSGSILPLLFGLILILSIGGFILYSSVELEPGDPLYDVIEGE